MATNIPLKKLLDQMGRGTLVSGAKIRAALQTAEVNVLRVTEHELHLLNKSIEAGLKSSQHQTRSASVKFQELVDGGTQVEGGDLDLAATTYSTMLKIGQKIGRIDKNGWHLGHSDLGNLAQRMSLILENYKVGGARFLNEEERIVVESAILGAQKLERLDDETLDQLREIQHRDTDALVAALAGSTKGLELDLRASSRFAKDAVSGNISITYSFEDKDRTSAKGDLSRNLSTSSGKYLKNLRSREGEALSKRLQEIWSKVLDPFSVSASPTIKELIADEMQAAFLGTKPKYKFKNKRGSEIRFKRRKKDANVQAAKLKTLIAKRLATLKTKTSAIKNKKKFLIPTVTLKAILNESLATVIRTKMELSGAPVSIGYLRNQTGNFSESAKILTLNRAETGAYTGTYQYDKYRYGIHEATSGRDPRNYIEGSARSIAIRVLKGQFKGIFLESK